MDIIIFLIGFVLGAIAVSIIFKMNQKNSQEKSDLLMNQMQLQFENLTNKIFKETSEDFTVKNKEKLEEIWNKEVPASGKART